MPPVPRRTAQNGNGAWTSLQPGNVLVVWKLDRVGRSTADLARIVTELDQRGIQFKSLTEGFLDTTTADGRLIFQIFSALAEHERSRTITAVKRLKPLAHGETATPVWDWAGAGQGCEGSFGAHSSGV